MKATQLLHNLGQSIWLDNITRDLLNSGTLKALHRRAIGHGADVEPHDLRPCHQEQLDLRCGHSREAEAGQVGRGAVFRPRAGRPHARCRSVPPDPRADQRRRRLGVARGLAAARPRHSKSTSPLPKSCIAPGRAAEPSDQDSRHQGGPAGHRGGDLCRRTDQCDAAVFARALFRRRRGVPARDRTAHRCWTQSQCRIGCLGVCQPLGRGGRRQGARELAQPTRHRHREADLQGVPRHSLSSPRWQRVYNAGARPQRLLWASTGTKDPKLHPTFCTSRRSPRRSPSTRCPRPR